MKLYRVTSEYYPDQMFETYVFISEEDAKEWAFEATGCSSFDRTLEDFSQREWLWHFRVIELFPWGGLADALKVRSAT